jgi:hypothetical protein
MLIKITSENPEMLSLLMKNPDSFGGVQLREIKNGVAIGRIVSPSEYHLVFQDTKYSFSEDASNQIDFQSYCNPRVFLTLVSSFLRHLLASKEDYFAGNIPWLKSGVKDIDCEGHAHTLTIENIYADGFSHNRGFVLSKYFPEIELEKKSGALFRMTISTNESLFRLINLAALACLYMAATNRQHWYINEDISRKYIRIIKNLSPVPYFVLYLFARSCLPSRELFNTLKPVLEDAYEGDVTMAWGNTQNMRIEAVGNRLIIDDVIPENIVEIGCGEMDYPRRMLGKVAEGQQWYSHDVDDYSHLVPSVRRRRGKDNLHFIKSLDEGPAADEDNALIMVEVIEHMPYAVALKNTRDVIARFNPNRAIITTPNKAFNKHFGLVAREFRHDDHHFEFTPKEFAKFMGLVTKDNSYRIEMFGIGDCVDGEYLSLGAMLTKLGA